MAESLLQDQIAVVTAAGGGAGSVIADTLARAGAQVFACDVDAKGLTALTSRNPTIHAIHADAGDESAIEHIVRGAGGRVDLLVNNVGIAGPTANAEDITLQDWNESIRVNLTSHFLFARAVIPGMKLRRSGLILNISSGSARVGLPMRLPYVVTKGAVLSMTKNLARELGPHGIRVNAILPGAIRGDRINRVIDAKASALGIDRIDYEKQLLRYVSLRTMVEPDDIAAMIVFLASAAGVRISGQMIGVDGNVEWEE
ncbi:SDR family oxidoreductase [Nitratireductor mangrovi]|uniref:SDR family oxidoreductase n=1 Tax=Nitratireductor mangrovi TaxID=2599600 RepID=A0A5B8L156_9HYPH|nr:SDR family oxidoreductase [Nitratireductor mangrovi]QDZ01308.2 SDR family oxidoreductase [Nitratireductor mangrovi]